MGTSFLTFPFLTTSPPLRAIPSIMFPCKPLNSLFCSWSPEQQSSLGPASYPRLFIKVFSQIKMVPTLRVTLVYQLLKTVVLNLSYSLEFLRSSVFLCVCFFFKINITPLASLEGLRLWFWPRFIFNIHVIPMCSRAEILCAKIKTFTLLHIYYMYLILQCILFHSLIFF